MNDNTTEKSPGELNLDVLIQSMQPVLVDETYVFATVDKTFDSTLVQPVMMFVEKEGVTLIVTQEAALKSGLSYEFPSGMITLNIHSSLAAVGFLARITQRLAAMQMGVNPVSAFYHDHLFVPIDRAGDAVAELKKMSAEIKSG